MAEWDFRLVNSFNVYLLRMFSMFGPVVGTGDITMNKKLQSSGETDKKIGNYESENLDPRSLINSLLPWVTQATCWSLSF